MEAEKEEVDNREAGIQKSFFVRLKSSVKPELRLEFKAILEREVSRRGKKRDQIRQA